MHTVVLRHAIRRYHTLVITHSRLSPERHIVYSVPAIWRVHIGTAQYGNFSTSHNAKIYV